MATLNQTDLNIRLQLINNCYSIMSEEFANNLKYGKKCSFSHRCNLALLAVYIEILECYQVGQTDNCFTETEIQALLEEISKLTGMDFQAIGYSYEVPEGYTYDSETGTISLT